MLYTSYCTPGYYSNGVYACIHPMFVFHLFIVNRLIILPEIIRLGRPPRVKQFRVVKMAACSRKRGSATADIDASTKQAKRQVSKETFNKWQRTYEAWLRCDIDAHQKTLVSTLWCVVCRKYELKISGHKNFSKAWIGASTNHKTSNITDHATSDQHKSAMMHFRKDQAKSRNEPITSYSPIARGLLSSSMDSAVRERVKKKFEISFVLAKEDLPFTKYPAIHALEEKHGVDLGQTYKNRDSARNFVHYIAEGQRRELHSSLSSCCFYSILMDGSVDKGRVENELMVILYCKRDDTSLEVKTCARFLCVLEPKKADSDGLLACLGTALKPLGVEDLFNRECSWCSTTPCSHWLWLRWRFRKCVSTKWNARKASGLFALVILGLVLRTSAGTSLQRCFDQSALP